MAIFDWVIVVVVGLSMLIGFIRGFLQEALSLIAWILALWLARTYCVEAGDFLHQTFTIPAPLFRVVAGFSAIFISSLLVFSLVSWLLAKIFIRGKANIGDRILGLVFGAVRGAAIIVVLLVVYKGFYGVESSGWVADSKFAHIFTPLTEMVWEMFPESGLVPDGEGSSSEADTSTSAGENNINPEAVGE